MDVAQTSGYVYFSGNLNFCSFSFYFAFTITYAAISNIFEYEKKFTRILENIQTKYFPPNLSRTVIDFVRFTKSINFSKKHKIPEKIRKTHRVRARFRFEKVCTSTIYSRVRIYIYIYI